MQYVTLNPGIYLRELAENLQLPIAVVQYHLGYLVKAGQVGEYRDGRYRRFFVAGVYGEPEQKVISQMRQETPAKILSIIVTHPNSSISHRELANALGITSQAVSWQMARLRAIGLIESTYVHGNGGLTYQLPSEFSSLVQIYVNSFSRIL